MAIHRLWSTFVIMWIKSFIIYISLIAVFQLSLARTCYADDSGGHVSESANAQSVITHLSTLTDTLSLNELRAIFSLRARAWPDGTKITVVVFQDTNPVHRSFLMNTLKMLPHQLRRQWDRYIYSGIGQGPVVVQSVEDMLATINNTPGAIGYVEGGMSNEHFTTVSIR
ncbi:MULTISPECIES: hypothetical protein [unclassified Oleiphilus]|uniref:hypothetical protein n=2 Tax=Oleiphilus TaxID=141450 RepID=UPI000A9587C2|nr:MULTISPECIES: hypothetical protein [unclassified Oleiphilus]